MAHDPFTPPRASLDLDEDFAPVPGRVRVAVVAIITAAVMSFAIKVAATLVDLLPTTLALLLLGFIAWKIFAGREWARWIFAAIVAIRLLGVVAMFYFPDELSISLPQPVRVASAIQLALDFIALVLLFTGDAGKWFRR